MSESDYYPELYMIIFSFLIIYTVSAAALEHFNFHYIHESGIAITLGVGLGLILTIVSGDAALNFDETTFFYIILPPIIFEAGFNLDRKEFAKNFSYIFIFGVLGTFVNFFVILYLSYWISELGWIYIQSSSDPTRTHTVVSLSMKDCFYFAATTCATDTVAAVTIIKAKKYPKLYSILFGESTLNDAVAVILFQVFEKLSNQQNIAINIDVLDTIFGEFFLIGFLSLIVGIVFGCICALLLKYMRFIKISPIFEISCIFFLAYVSYIFCRYFDLSGIISLLVCGIVMAHYSFHNLTITAKLSTGITFKLLSHMVEGFLFVYLGLVCVFKEWEWSIGLIFLLLAILFIGRIVNILLMSAIFKVVYKISGLQWNLDIYEIILIIIAGSIRGSVAFALILLMTGSNADLLQVTTYILLMILTIILGGLMPVILKFILRLRDKTGIGEISDKPEKNNGTKLDESQTNENKLNFLEKAWKKLEENYLKPFFIYNYNDIKHEMKLLKTKTVNEIYRVELLDFQEQIPVSMTEFRIKHLDDNE